MASFRERYRLSYLACEWAKRLLKYAVTLYSELIDEDTLCALRGEQPAKIQRMHISTHKELI